MTPSPWPGRTCPPQRPAHPRLPDGVTASRRRGASSTCMGALVTLVCTSTSIRRVFESAACLIQAQSVQIVCQLSNPMTYRASTRYLIQRSLYVSRYLTSQQSVKCPQAVHIHPTAQTRSRTYTSMIPSPWPGRTCPPQRPAHPRLPDGVTASRRRGAGSTCTMALVTTVSNSRIRSLNPRRSCRESECRPLVITSQISSA
jgi:hypothetical protein